jgi:hypothetical protein
MSIEKAFNYSTAVETAGAVAAVLENLELYFYAGSA